MTENIIDDSSIYLGELDEYLATKLLETTSRPLGFSVSKLDSQGNIIINQIETKNKIEEGGIDFELSPSEYQSLSPIEIEDFTKQTIYTSSAYELFDFLLMYFSKLEFVTDFSGSSWMVTILDTK